MLKKGSVASSLLSAGLSEIRARPAVEFRGLSAAVFLEFQVLQFSMQLVTGADSRKKGNGILETGFSNKKECCLVVYLPYPSEKYEFVNGKDDIPYIYIYTIYYGKKMFQTTNQNGFEFHLP